VAHLPIRQKGTDVDEIEKAVKLLFIKWADVISLFSVAGTIASVNYTPAQDLTIRRVIFDVISSVAVGFAVIYFLSFVDYPEKTKIGIAFFAAHAQKPLLRGAYKLAGRFESNPEKFIRK